MNENEAELMNEYFSTKEIARRNVILKQLAVKYPENAKDFFLRAFKKERYLDMKCRAVS